MKRRLAAILAADVVAYSRLMGADEQGTLSRLKVLRRDLIEPLVAEHRGRIFKLMGDGLLVEFASVVDAVACASDWQERLHKRETEGDKETRLQFRIGINLGDVIAEGEDLYGDGVNVAARLEGLAPVGGICLSAMVRESIKGKLAIELESIGPQTLKNIAERSRYFLYTLGTPRMRRRPETPASQRLKPTSPRSRFCHSRTCPGTRSRSISPTALPKTF